MSGLGGFAAGLAEGFASGRRLKSDLETEKTRREAMGLQMEEMRLKNAQLQEQREATEAATKLEKAWSSGEGFRPQEADANYDHRTDPAAVSRYYENLRSVMRRQAAAFGRSQVDADEAVDRVIKSQLAERTGKTISMLKMAPERAGGDIQKLYDAFPDGGKISKVAYDPAKDVYVMTGKGPDGTEGTVERSRRDVIEALSFGALNGRDAAAMNIRILENERNQGREDTRLGMKIDSDQSIARGRNATTLEATDREVQGGIQRAIISGQATVAASGLRGPGGAGAEMNDARQRLKAQIDSIEKVFGPEYDAVKGDQRNSFSPEQRNKAIREIQGKQALAEDIIRVNFENGNENLSARGASVLASDIYTKTVDRSRFNGYLVRDGKQDKNFVVMDGGRLIVPTPGWLRQELEKKPSAAPSGPRTNARTGAPVPEVTLPTRAGVRPAQ